MRVTNDRAFLGGKAITVARAMSEEVRQLLKANPEMTVKEATEKGIKISNALFYYTKGQSCLSRI